MKKITSLMMTLLFIFSTIAVPVYAAELPEVNTYAGAIDILDVVNNPEKYPDLKITIHRTAADFVEHLYEDTNMSQSERDDIISTVAATPAVCGSSYTGYVTVNDYASIKDGYAVNPYFYCQVSASDPNIYNITSFNTILWGNIDRDCNGLVKEFSGTLSYNLEAYNRLFWDLNGTFYDTGTTTWVINASANLGGGAGSVGFAVGGEGSYFAYKHIMDYIVFNI